MTLAQTRPVLVAASLLLSAALAWLCYRAAGATLGMFLGGLGVVTILTPPLTLAAHHWRSRFAVLAAIIVGVAGVWLALLGQAKVPVTFMEWARCVIVLAAYSTALCELALLGSRLIPAALASGLMVIIASLWLTWPIWMAPHLKGQSSQRLVAVLVAPHPLFTMDAVLSRPMGTPWALSPLAYRWTNLGDDIPYQRPSTILWCVGLHLLVAGITLVRFGYQRDDQRDAGAAASAG